MPNEIKFLKKVSFKFHWRKGLGPIVIPAAVAGRENRKPWKKYETNADDLASLNVQENLNRISNNFCSWLQKLPGKTYINHIYFSTKSPYIHTPDS